MRVPSTLVILTLLIITASISVPAYAVNDSSVNECLVLLDQTIDQLANLTVRYSDLVDNTTETQASLNLCQSTKSELGSDVSSCGIELASYKSNNTALLSTKVDLESNVSKVTGLLATANTRASTCSASLTTTQEKATRDRMVWFIVGAGLVYVYYNRQKFLSSTEREYGEREPYQKRIYGDRERY